MSVSNRALAVSVVLSLAVGFLRLPVAAQPSQELKDWLTGRLKDTGLVESLLAEHLGFVRMKQDRERMALTLGSGLISDTADGQMAKSLVNVEARASRGQYPDELDFRFSSLMEVKQGALNEYVSAMQMSYERYILQEVEIFGFFERFSDTFLHLQQRYEIGLGVKYESNLPDAGDGSLIAAGAFSAQLEELQRSLLGEYASCAGLAAAYGAKSGAKTVEAAAAAALGLYRRLIVGKPGAFGPAEASSACRERLSELGGQADSRGALPPAAPELMTRLSGRLDKLRKAHDQLRDMIIGQDEARMVLKKSGAKLSWGISASVFYEADRSQAAWTETGTITTLPDPVSLPAEQRYRLALRPSFTWRPVPGLSFDLKYYFKLPLLGDLKKRSLLAGKDVSDVRHDARFVASYLHPKPVWAARVGLSFEYNYAFDNVPSYLDEQVFRSAIIDAGLFPAAPESEVLEALLKERRHGQAKLSLTVSF